VHVTQTFDPVCLEALGRLLAQPDPADLLRRAHALRWDGDPDRRFTRLPPILMSWLQWRHLENDIEEPVATAATRTWKRRAVKPAPSVLRAFSIAQERCA
jgi:hypothetical protein